MFFPYRATPAFTNPLTGFATGDMSGAAAAPLGGALAAGARAASLGRPVQIHELDRERFESRPDGRRLGRGGLPDASTTEAVVHRSKRGLTEWCDTAQDSPPARQP